MGKIIDGDELIELLLSTAITDKQREYSECVQYAVQKMPTVDAVPVRHGQWIHHDSNDCHVPSYDECDQCGWKVRIGLNYCPKCGAGMRKNGDGNG